MVSKPIKLTSNHVLSEFDCGKESLTTWLQRYALQNQSANHAKTVVITEDNSNVVAGYYSYNVISVDHGETTPERVSKGLARHPIPVFVIARLAVDKKYQGKKLGSRLLRRALLHAAEISETVPIRAVVVDALDEGAQTFYRSFDFEPFPEDGLRMWLLLKDLLKAQRAFSDDE